MTEKTAPLDVQQLILAQLREITAEVRLIPQILARLDALSADQKRLERRDEALQQQTDTLALRASESAAAMSILNAELRDLRRQHETCPALKDGERVRVLEQQSHGAMDALNQQNLRIRKIEEGLLDEDVRQQIGKCVIEFHEWRPWLRGIKWAAGIAGGAVLLVIVAAIIWAVVQSGAGLP